jgi:outer membrane protein OmpA-like peptidoglycan-associated protein
MRLFFAPLLALVFAVAGCSTPAPQAPPPGPVTPAQRATLAEALAVERQWLASWFRGTPVVLAQRSTGAVTIDVPREFSFEPGRSKVKPALGAVLDKVAESLLRVPSAYVVIVAAPDDTAVSGPLAQQRAAQVHEHLRARGVAAARIARPSTAGAGTVHLRLAAPPAAAAP